MREKLNDHIIYLQNEIRKRDELLEGGSEFGGDDDFADDSIYDEEFSKGGIGKDETSGGGSQQAQTEPMTTPRNISGIITPRPKRRTMGQILKQQLEETRQSLKAQIEARLRADKELSQSKQQTAKLTEGLQDILTLANQQIAK